MNTAILKILEQVRQASLGPDEAEKRIDALYHSDLGFADLDLRRGDRTAYPEVVYCAGKTCEQALSIMAKMREHGLPVFATKASKEIADKAAASFGETEYHELSRTLSIGSLYAESEREGLVVVAAAGTSDLNVAWEAARTAEFFGSNVRMVNDIGVAGIHRLFKRLDEIRAARVVIACAGMEGALAGVIAGLVPVPVIALPTSVGYGASFGGLSALLGMLTSCAPGVSVVNINNGFGAGYQANLINRPGGQPLYASPPPASGFHTSPPLRKGR
ncbi:MAG: nickel pincer cofactor biosynthesis protein LarB [Spirochaetaceae bacterium]|jgi:NCAIR mutase (PurE)-related protein|nr:nickel pincer cofactor biosynthesis protein LarB [Spirochaetaceae bacterium]